MAFSKEIKREIRSEQENICAYSGQRVDLLEIHHRYPMCKGGSNNKINGVGLAGQESYTVYGVMAQDTHEYLDQMALKENLYLHPDGRMVPKEELPPECFKNESIACMPDVRIINKENNLRKTERNKKKHKRKR